MMKFRGIKEERKKFHVAKLNFLMKKTKDQGLSDVETIEQHAYILTNALTKVKL